MKLFVTVQLLLLAFCCCDAKRLMENISVEEASSSLLSSNQKVYPKPDNLCLGGIFGGKCFTVPPDPEHFFSLLLDSCGEKNGCEGFKILDVGANRGAYLKVIEEKAPNAQAVAFEPHPLLSDVLINRYADNKNVEVYNAGLSISRGVLSASIDYKASANEYQAVRFIRSCADLSTIDQQKYNKTCQKIPVFPLDEVCDYKVNILKIDVQGHELNVLLGGFTQYVQHGYDVILTELSPSLFESEAHARLYLKMLAAGGYRVYATQQLSPKLRVTAIDLPAEGVEIAKWEEIKKMRNTGSWADIIAIRDGLEIS